MADEEEWSSDANEAISISFIQPAAGGPKALSTFHPKYTFPIFGDEERIFGYQGLRIHFRFAAHDLQPNVEISYDKKFKAVGETKAMDIGETLREYLPPSAFDKTASFNAKIQDDDLAKDFKPPGELIRKYTSKGRNFEIWCGELTDPAVQRLIERIQVLILFFIDGGTMVALDDQEWSISRWRVFFVYEKLPNPPTPTASLYSIVGYSTSYRFLSYTTSRTTSPSKGKLPPQELTFPAPQPISPASLPSRDRISQFLILPSHQSHWHGTHLYNAMYSTFHSSTTTTEITVEDPNEAFDDLRDYCDYTRLLTNGTFAKIKLNTSIPPALTSKRIGVRVPTSSLLDLPLLESLRRKNKIAPRQFARLVELYLLSTIPPHNRQAGTSRLTQRAKASDEGDRAYYYWRLLVKQRVYKRNKDQLIQLDKADRIDKVEETVGDLVGDYERLLRGVEARKMGWGGDGVAVGQGERRERAKRKVIKEDDDEDEDVAMDEERDGDEGARREVKRSKQSSVS